MFCKKCGKELQEGEKFCSVCGSAVEQPVQQPAEPIYQQPVQPVYQQPVRPENPVAPQPSMGWFKFLIYFSLFAGAVLNVINGISMLTGSQYGDSAKLVYAMIKDLQTFDMICGILCLGLAAFAVYVRFQLSAYKKNAPKLLTISYAAVLVYDLIYVIGLNSILPELIKKSVDFSSAYGSMVASAAILIINIAYFKKRQHLFVN